MKTEFDAPQMLDDMSRALTGLRSEMLGAETLAPDGLADLPEPSQASARNLLHYLALRSGDRRSLQALLHALGLSSLGRAEAHARSQVEAVHDLWRRSAATAISPWSAGSSGWRRCRKRFCGWRRRRICP